MPRSQPEPSNAHAALVAVCMRRWLKTEDEEQTRAWPSPPSTPVRKSKHRAKPYDRRTSGHNRDKRSCFPSPSDLPAFDTSSDGSSCGSPISPRTPTDSDPRVGLAMMVPEATALEGLQMPFLPLRYEPFEEFVSALDVQPLQLSVPNSVLDGLFEAYIDKDAYAEEATACE